MKNITPQQLKEKMKLARRGGNKENFILLDVRTPEEFAENNIEGAISLPLQEISQENLRRVSLDDKKKEIVVYCRAGSRSATAAAILNNFGFTNVYNLEGGISNWK
ncbi:rhodanese-like domain-containing protein [Patescibacteria group bacterium]|nr:rhodanese-like domain-containing protein [Patescibacteria group bacterium]